MGGNTGKTIQTVAVWKSTLKRVSVATGSTFTVSLNKKRDFFIIGITIFFRFIFVVWIILNAKKIRTER